MTVSSRTSDARSLGEPPTPDRTTVFFGLIRDTYRLDEINSQTCIKYQIGRIFPSVSESQNIFVAASSKIVR